MEYETVLVERRGGIGILTLNRPDRLNAMNQVLLREYGAAVADLNADPEVGAIVVTGAGRAFSAGGDMASFQAQLESAGQVPPAQPPRPVDNTEWLLACRAGKPMVAAINGAAIGAGITITLACDARIASTTALFSLRFVKVGIVPELGSSQILSHIIGMANALDLCISGRNFDAQEAVRIGLVREAVEPEDLLPRSLSLAGAYAENGPQTVLEVKRLLYANFLEPDFVAARRRELEALARCATYPERAEAVAAFRERRNPDFRALYAARS